MKEKILKSLFLISSTVIGIIILGSVSFLITNPKLTYYEYVSGFIKFMVEFLFISLICGGVGLLFFYSMIKLYKKIFTEK